MMIYIGAGSQNQNRAARDKYGCGIQIGPNNPRNIEGHRYMLDNGAYPAWVRGETWNEAGFYALVARLEAGGYPPDLVVVPDIVGGGLASLERSLEHVARLPPAWPRYLAVQPGITPGDVAPLLSRFDGLFIGGASAWRWRTAAAWIELAHAAGKPAHIGMVGTVRNYLRAAAMGADSVDGAGPMRNRDLDVVGRFHRLVAEQVCLSQAVSP
jgi:NADPH:quinone reductase-like Zn-dependent oxidoreductase